MDENRNVNTLKDELGLEIERVLAVDPAPDLKARVRARIDHERTAPAWWMSWRLASAGALAAAGVAALILSAPERQVDQVSLSAQPGSVATADATPAAVAAPEPLQPIGRVPVARARRSSRQSAAVGQMAIPVLTSAREAAALRLLVANIRDGYIDPGVLSQVEPVGTPLQPLAEIDIQPITIEPLARQELPEGAPQ